MEYTTTMAATVAMVIITARPRSTASIVSSAGRSRTYSATTACAMAKKEGPSANWKENAPNRSAWSISATPATSADSEHRAFQAGPQTQDPGMSLLSTTLPSYGNP